MVTSWRDNFRRALNLIFTMTTGIHSFLVFATKYEETSIKKWGLGAHKAVQDITSCCSQLKIFLADLFIKLKSSLL